MTVLRDELQRTLGAAYTLERELGGGGMSTVFVARDNALGRTVVVKVLPYELAASVSVDRFKREIMLSAALQHPHIVPVLSAGETDGLPFFIMPFVEGESLRARLARGPLSVRESVSILKDVSRALTYAHGRGIIHRDIKPDNILLSGGSATVTDFGVAKAITASRERSQPLGKTRVGTITLVGTSIGTPAYMAPEQAAGDPNTDHRADLYALGIVGYEMLVGTPPFQGRAPQQLLAAQLTETPPAIGTRRYDVPAALATLVMQLLEKDPNKRPKTAADITRALDDPSVVSGTFASASMPRQSRPKRVIWAFAGAGILASVAAGGAWFSKQRSEDNAGASAAASAAALVPVGAMKSIAVMPLVNLSPDTSDAYFAAGMTAAISNALIRIQGLRVATGAEHAPAEQASSPAEVGKALNVNTVLYGTVQRDKDRLRVTARLVNAADGFTVWSDMFEREVKDVFAVQDEISHAIVQAISPELSAPVAPSALATDSAGAHGTTDLQAYDLYIRGNYFLDKRGETSLRRALDYFQQATQRDPKFARAFAGIANVYALLPLYANVRIDSMMPAAMSAVNKAIALDSMLAEGFASRAALLQAAWKWPAAEKDYLRALRLDPNSAATHQWYGELLLIGGNMHDAQTQLRRAVELDPLSPIAFGSFGLALAASRRADTSVVVARRAVELDSTLLAARFMLGTVYLEAGRLAEGTKELEAAEQLDSASVPTLGLLGYAYAKAGKTQQATQIAQTLESKVGKATSAGPAAARVYIGLGDTDRALSLLEGAVADHDVFFSSESLTETFFDPIRANPRFTALLKRVGIDEKVSLRQ
ncbi:MAG TPA: protein kinase [Gemmatimonadaceae bacterium]|nr:protein kinase [Gemmatimonadaceae bacterium]